MNRFVGCFLCLFFTLQPVLGQQAQPRPMQIDDLFSFKRVADPQISPNGKWVVYGLGVVDMEANKINRSLWIAAADRSSPPVQLVGASKGDRRPRWSPDGSSILFEATRSGTSQLWLATPPEKGTPGGFQQLTTISTGASGAVWSRDGKHIAFVSGVWPEYSAKPFAESDALNKKREDEQEKNPVKAKVFTKLFFRHWDEYVNDKRQHLFVIDLEAGKASDPRDVTPGDRDAFPTSSTFSTGDDFTFSPDSKYLVFTAVPEKNEAWSTNYDICRVPIAGGKVENLTAENKAADSGPQFSPDGKWLAYRAQRKPGFEADRWELMLLPADGVGIPWSLTSQFDSQVDGFTWMPDSDMIYVNAEEKGRSCYFAAKVKDNDGTVQKSGFLNQHGNHDLTVSRDGNTVAFTRVAMHQPAEVMSATWGKGADGKESWTVRNISKANEKLLAQLDLSRPESVTVTGAGGTPVQMWILKPPGFDEKKKWPLAFLVHGGPQGAWEDGWSFRWNPQLWAAQGYVVALPNPRGSTGFGQKFVDEISADWGGKCYEDLMACLAHLEKQPWIDSERMGAAGASFGGYMINWFAVNTPKFKTLITHCGVWNFDSMYATTEELWFDEWEHGGPPWGKVRDSYEKHSPHRRAANLSKFKTPMLIIHNDLDFRVPVSEGIQLFTTLQRQGVPSRFINFPDEGHWVLKPRNSQFWHREVFAWLKKHVPPGGK